MRGRTESSAVCFEACSGTVQVTGPKRCVITSCDLVDGRRSSTETRRMLTRVVLHLNVFLLNQSNESGWGSD